MGGTLFWVGVGAWRCTGHSFGWLRVSGALLLVGGSGWENVLGGWG